MARDVLGRHPQHAEHEGVGDVDHRDRQLVEVAGKHRENDHARRDEADFDAPEQGKADLATLEGRPPDKRERHRHDAPLVHGAQPRNQNDRFAGRVAARNAQSEAENDKAAEHVYIGSGGLAVVARGAAGGVGRHGAGALPAEESERRHGDAHENGGFMRGERERPARDRAQGKGGEAVGNRQASVDAHVSHGPHGPAQGTGDACGHIERQTAVRPRRQNEGGGRAKRHEHDGHEGDCALRLRARTFGQCAQGAHEEGEAVGELVDHRVDAEVALHVEAEQVALQPHASGGEPQETGEGSAAEGAFERRPCAIVHGHRCPPLVDTWGSLYARAPAVGEGGSRVTTSRAPVVTRNPQQGRQRSASPRPAGRAG